MSNTSSTRRPAELEEDLEALSADGGDPVLGHLNRAGSEYRELRASSERQIADLKSTLGDTQDQLAAARETQERLKREAEASRRQLEAERRKAAQQRDRANQLASALKEVHRSLFSGNVYLLILKACLTITGASRGLYVTTRGKEDTARIRAAVEVSGYPQLPPSDFIKALCRKVLEDNEPLVCNSEADRGDLPRPSRESEQFRNCIVAPVVILKNLDGIVIVADKISGEFDEADTDAILEVGDQAAVAVENADLQHELQAAYVATVSMLADAVHAKDSYTGGHSKTVLRLARLTAERMALSEYDASVACYAALLHDVGKIGVSDGVLNKPGPLLPEERELVRSHVRVGHDLIDNVPVLHGVAEAVLHHHEAYDGTGYPEGLRGEEIPIAARVVAVVDAYCAMITRRSYKEPYPDEYARQELVRCSGSQFDPRVVEAFLQVLDTPEGRDWDPDEELDLVPGLVHLRQPRKAA
jgi:HD-GYP domain-containing protein (c-di-GMP phosphodiesterase class II)